MKTRRRLTKKQREAALILEPRIKKDHDFDASTSWDGSELPKKCEGWTAEIPKDRTLFVAAIRCIRLANGGSRKYYRMVVKEQERKRLQKEVKSKLKKIKRENRVAEQKRDKAAKRSVRALLAMMGK